MIPEKNLNLLNRLTLNFVHISNSNKNNNNKIDQDFSHKIKSYKMFI